MNEGTVERRMGNSKPLLLLAVLLLAGCAGVKDTSRTFQTVVIDPGHGGKDPGAHSRRGGLEKANALDVALHVNDDLRRAGLRTVMTRTCDVFIPLNDRAAISNMQENAVFVSIHFNDSRNHGIRGVEAYYNSGPAAQLAGRIETNLGRIAPIRFRKFARFRVLRYNQYPAVLIECGYLSNNSEAGLCASPAYRAKLADGIAQGVIEQRYGEEAARRLAEAAPAAAQRPSAPRSNWSPESLSR